MIFRDGISNRLQQHRFTRSRRGDDDRTLAFSDRCYEIDDARGNLGGIGFDLHVELLVGIKRRQIVKENLLSRLFGGFKIYRLDLNQRKISLAFFWGSDLTRDRVAGA